MRFFKIIHLAKSEYSIVEDTPLLFTFLRWLVWVCLYKPYKLPAVRFPRLSSEVFISLVVAAVVAWITYTLTLVSVGQELRQELATLGFSLVSGLFGVIYCYSVKAGCNG